MDSKVLMGEIYNDFFGSNSSLVKVDENKEEESNISLIDDLLLTDESKELLKKIISYMEKNNSNHDNKYINFNITVEGNNKNTLSEIIKILEYYSKKYNYVKSSSCNISFYELQKIEEVLDNYNNNGIITFLDLPALSMNDVNFQKKYFYTLKEELNKEKITIIFGKKDELKTFIQSDNELENYFVFNLVCAKADVNDIYQSILEKISNKNYSDDLLVKLLDYITESYPKSNLDSNKYIDNLYNYISFYDKVPEMEKIKTIEEVFKNLNELVGLEKVKKSLNDLVDLITLKNKTKDDLKINNINLHMVFLGNPGTGKTTVARLIADILYQLKYIRQNKLIEVSSKDLVAEYVGQTAVKTMNVVDKAKGGILFIDEAYALSTKNNDNSFNGECIATLIKAMEDYRDDLVVIFAGYTKEMQDFLDSNSGIVSRIGYTLEFEDYTNNELIEIFKGMALKSGFIVEEDALNEINKLIDENRDSKNFGNARFIRNVFEKTIIRHASNTKNIKSKKILKTITKKDICYE